MILLATSFPIPHSHATTEEFEIPDPLTSSFCEETLNDPKKKDLLEKEEIEQCEELVEVENTPPTESEAPPTPETSPPETSPPENEDPSTPETPPTENEDPSTPETPPTESEDPPTPETTPSESEDSPTPETPPTDEEKNKIPDQPDSGKAESANEIETPVLKSPKPRQEKQQAVAPTLVSVNAIGISNLSASYSAATQTINLDNNISRLVGLDLSSAYIIFRLPPEVMQSIEASSVKLQYRYNGLLGSGSQMSDVTATIDRTNNQIYAAVSESLKASLLSSDKFTLSFKVGKLPVGVDKVYTFRSTLANGLIDLNVLSSGTATATLGIGPTFNLIVPDTLDFGSHELTGREKIIPRLFPMTISISHENATGYNWKLQANLSRPLTSKENHVLNDVLYFKTTSKTQLLQATAIEIATGTMSASSNQTPLTYAENEGIILDLTGKYPKPSSYSADIQWSLINAP